MLFSAAYRPDSGLAALWSLRGARLLTSPYAIEEARRNLEEDRQRSRLVQLLGHVEVIQAVAPMAVDVDLPDKDQPILLAAVAGRASHLITGDVRHFGRFFGKKVMGILVQPPALYLKQSPPGRGELSKGS